MKLKATLVVALLIQLTLELKQKGKTYDDLEQILKDDPDNKMHHISTHASI